MRKRSEGVRIANPARDGDGEGRAREGRGGEGVGWELRANFSSLGSLCFGSKVAGRTDERTNGGADGRTCRSSSAARELGDTDGKRQSNRRGRTCEGRSLGGGQRLSKRQGRQIIAGVVSTSGLCESDDEGKLEFRQLV